MPGFDAKVYALPPGVDFARELVAGLTARMAAEPPEAMARLQLYLSSGRMQRRVRDAFDQMGATFLPQLHLVSDLSRAPVPGLLPAVPALRRKLELARLVEGLARRLPAFEAGAGIFSLADSLGALMAEMQSEGVSPEAFERLDIQASHAEHWRNSLEFLRIVARFFEAGSAPDPEGRQRRVAEHLAGLWAVSPTQERIIVAGSTGSRGATRLLMQAVAALPHGALVLPGFDFDMPAAVWGALASEGMPLEDHPQFRFRTLLDALAMGPEQVSRWTNALPPSAERNALVSLALRPAPVTDQWMAEGRKLGNLPVACRDVSLIEAPDPRREALAIALALRAAVERGQSAALISPDRMLTRRVAAALDRWGLVPDDSAGLPLLHSTPGRLIRHVARLMGRPISIEALIVLLKHPLAATGSTLRGEHLRLTRELELRLRRKGPAFPTAQALSLWAKPGTPLQQEWAAWVGSLLEAFDGAADRPIAGWLAAQVALLERIAAGPGGDVAASSLWQGEAGQASFRMLAELRIEARGSEAISAANYTDLIDTLLEKGQVRNPVAARPGLAVLGTLEARAHGAELVILAGLNEGSWPEMPAPDPWLSRKMRLDAGLLLPERQIGLAAHDFQQAIGAPKVILSRSKRDSEAETVPSRWMNRLLNLMMGLPDRQGPEALQEMRARGDHWMHLAQALEKPLQRAAPAHRPSPRPPAEARPRELPVTAIKTLIRDPYALYAQRILRLRPLDPLRPQPDPRLRGDVLHEIVERFVREHPADEPLDLAQERLLAIAEATLAEQVPWPSTQRIWLARIARIARKFVADEAARQARGTPAIIESRASAGLGALAFTLSAKPDRIDVLHDGTAQIFDYKSGKPPSDDEVRHFDKQLLLEAALVVRGAFEAIGPREVLAMTYVQLGGTGEVRDLKLGAEDVDETWAKLEQLIGRYLQADQGFTARRALQLARAGSDYDHLSRFGEWDMTDTPAPEDVG